MTSTIPTSAAAARTGTRVVKRILIVEDDEVSRLTIGAMLQETGKALDFTVEVLDAGDGLEGLRILTEEHNHRRQIDLILCDLYMPRMYGTAFFERIHTFEGLSFARDIPFVIISTEFDPAKINAAIHAGVSDWLCKPVTLPQIQRMFVNLAFRHATV